MLRQGLGWLAVIGGVLAPVVQAEAMSPVARNGDGPGIRELESAPVPTLAPFAHVVFCKRNPGECRSDGRGDRLVEASAATLKVIRQVNARVNGSIRPVHDAAGPLGDVWTVGPSRGDCDDYAVTKRHALVAQGFPVSALRLAVAKTRDGIGHAVLVVRTTSGDLVMDNRSQRILPWVETDLRMLKIQSGADPSRWNDGLENVASRQ